MTLSRTPENVALRRILPQWRPHYFVEYKATSKIFAVINHQYIDLHHNFISQCISVILKVACVNKERSGQTATSPIHSQETDLFMSYYNACKYKRSGLLTYFHYILNPPRSYIPLISLYIFSLISQ